jgi:hypothetical protein
MLKNRYIDAFVPKTAFRISHISLKIFIATYLYSLDSEKSKVYFCDHSFQEKKMSGHTRPQNFGQKNSKNDHFKANPRLVKSNYYPKIILTYNI